MNETRAHFSLNPKLFSLLHRAQEQAALQFKSNNSRYLTKKKKKKRAKHTLHAGRELTEFIPNKSSKRLPTITRARIFK